MVREDNEYPPGYSALYGSSPDFPDVPDLEADPIEALDGSMLDEMAREYEDGTWEGHGEILLGCPSRETDRGAMSVTENERQFFTEIVQRLQLSEDGDSPEPDFDAMIYSLVSTYFNAGATAFAELVDEHRMQLSIACAMSDDLRQVVLIGLRMGIDENNGACAHELGALYYTGDIVEQDYAKAAEYYEIAANLGYVQAIVNLGYIYEYGRIGQPDYAKAYMYYSFAAAAFQDAEALCKMGDMFSRGKAVQKNGKAAITLWGRSFDSADNDEFKALAALRMAQVLVDEDVCDELGVQFDPLMALQLFQTSEFRFRVAIANGLTYYEKRLGEAIEGQAKARSLLDQ